MLLGRILTADGVVPARREGDGWVRIEDPYAAFAEGRVPADLGPVQGEVQAPAESMVVVGIAQNGPGHASPVQAWLKSPRSVVGSAVPVRLRRDAGATVAEGEIAVVIGRRTDGLTAANAHTYVLGITAVNDLSSPERAVLDPRNFESKSGDGYTPLGPWIDTELDLDDVALAVEVDGEIVATTGASALPVPIRDCLAYVAAWSTLGPGDVVMTGAPYSQAPVRPGQTVAVTVGGVRLETPLR
ncbi:2-keto-4-pentenoate hydratase [Microbacterium sp. 8M]|uniref:fumarylacetoacetate hydrolase family protein n=1 Tax=Microbacterium sp. 8M TaxID=2653153 RepID=UPI0012F216FB|nr:fumarylacetoacetate hydrolase family protein [Microbacterium sp. 8M]VXB15376.1 2-keto-4-pentenoate hydratase [Microbacterium sp. 8M]